MLPASRCSLNPKTLQSHCIIVRRSQFRNVEIIVLVILISKGTPRTLDVTAGRRWLAQKAKQMHCNDHDDRYAGKIENDITHGKSSFLVSRLDVEQYGYIPIQQAVSTVRIETGPRGLSAL